MITMQGAGAVSPQEARVPASCDHLVRVPGGRWYLWRIGVLRGAGFPVSLVEPMAALDAADATDRYLEARAAAPRRKGAGSSPAEQLVGDRRQEFVAALEAAEVTLFDYLQRVAAEPRFREAATWQSGTAVRHAAAELRRGRNKRAREAARFIALLAQRYAVKNDTAGFFGPVGWVELDARSGYVAMDTPEPLTSGVSVYFEGWAIDALIARLNEDPDVRRWCPPRLRTGAWIGADGLHLPFVGKASLSPTELRLIESCDGVTPAWEIATRLVGEAPRLFAREQVVFALLERAADRGLLSWCLEVPSQLHPEAALAERISRIGDTALRRRCEGPLDELTAARDAVARASGDAERLEEALADLAAIFSRITGEAPNRRAGRTYAGRGLVYMDARRSGDVTLGGDFLAAIGPALSIVLDGVRWLIGEVAITVSMWLRERHAELRRRLGCDALDAEVFVSQVEAALLPGGPIDLVLGEVQRRYQDTWRAVLADPVTEAPYRSLYDPLRAQSAAARLFEPRAAGWTVARQLSPDLMVSAAGPRAFARGEFQCVLGELHCSNTIACSALVAQHPSVERLFEAVAADTAGADVVLTQRPKADWLARLNPALVLPEFWRFETAPDVPHLPRCRSLPAAKLLAVEGPDGVRIRARDGSFACDAIELFAERLNPVVSRIAGELVPPDPHTPRLTLGRMIVARERWNLSAADMPFAHERDAAGRFAGARAWAARWGMPRRVFYKTPEEPKPCYLDFTSPVYVDIFAKMVRQMPAESVLRVSEMHPDVDGTWLTDGSGRRYTCELRLVARRIDSD